MRGTYTTLRPMFRCRAARCCGATSIITPRSLAVSPSCKRTVAMRQMMLVKSGLATWSITMRGNRSFSTQLPTKTLKSSAVRRNKARQTSSKPQCVALYSVSRCGYINGPEKVNFFMFWTTRFFCTSALFDRKHEVFRPRSFALIFYIQHCCCADQQLPRLCVDQHFQWRYKIDR